MNIQPDPVKFVQLTAPYWTDYAANWTMLGYVPPPGCDIVARNSNLTQYCSPDAFTIPEGMSLNLTISHCEACIPEAGGARWSYMYWLLTTMPGVFGMPNGVANPTGVALIIILTIMFTCSLSYVRRSGYFQVFYVTHMLYFLYWALLLMHAPDFWKWFIGPACIFVVEITYRILTSFLGRGKTVVSAGVILPSRVTHLIIKRPAGFNFSPGDWVFIKIPEVARFEWHPFTISSAPEVHDTFHVHIRGCGEWTNRLYKHFEDEYARQQAGMLQRENKIERFRGTVRQKYDNARTIMSKSIRKKSTEDTDFVSLAEKYTVDIDRQKERINRREEKLRQLSNTLSEEENNNSEEMPQGFNKKFLKSLRYLRQEPTVIKYDTGSAAELQVPPGLTYDDGNERFELMVSDSGELRNRKISHYDGPGKRAKLNKPLEVKISFVLLNYSLSSMIFRFILTDRSGLPPAIYTEQSMRYLLEPGLELHHSPQYFSPSCIGNKQTKLLLILFLQKCDNFFHS